MSGDDEELASQVAGIFLNDIPKQIASLKEALATGDAKTAERTAHSIKGASATVGAEQLREVSFRGEQFGRDGRLDELSALVGEIETQFFLLEKELLAAGYESMDMDI